MNFIKTYLIYILVAAIAILGVAVGVQSYRVTSKQVTIEKQAGDLKLLNGTVDAYVKGAKDNATAVQEIQKIKTTMSKLDSRIANASPGKCMSKEDEKLFTDIFSSYNDGVREAVGSDSGK